MNANVLTGVIEASRAREVELRLTIKRICQGDTAELVRAVVERVTEAMEMALAHCDSDEALQSVVDAKRKAFEEVTGRAFETTSTRSLILRGEIRRAAKGDQ